MNKFLCSLSCTWMTILDCLFYAFDSLCTSHLYPLLPHLSGWAGIMTLHFSNPWYISSALWGQADDNNPTLSPTLHYRKSHRGRCPNAITPHFFGTAGTIKKYLPCTVAWLFHRYPHRWEGGAGGRGYKWLVHYLEVFHWKILLNWYMKLHGCNIPVMFFSNSGAIFSL